MVDQPLAVEASRRYRRALRMPPAVSGWSLGVFVWSRVGIWLVALGFFYTDSRFSHSPAEVTGVWSRWDSLLLLRVAEHGYTALYPTDTAFYPVYPAIVGALGRVLDRHFLLAGIAVSLAACLVAFQLLYHLAERHLGTAAARRSVLYLALFPTALFLQAVYTESLALMLVLAAFLLAERDRFAAAGPVAGLALLTRPSVALVPALAVVAWETAERWRNLLLLAVAPLMFLAYPLYLWAHAGDPFAFSKAEGSWHRQLSAAGPLGGLWDGLRAGWAGVRQLAAGSSRHVYWAPGGDSDPRRVAVVNVAALAFLAVFVALTVVVWRRLPAAYGVYATLAIALPLCVPSHKFPLLSMPRFGLTVFPLFLALAVVGVRPRAHLAIVACSSVLLVAAIEEWARGRWVS
jgi:hypothetical protein